MEDVLRALNALVERGVIRNYAIGGAIAASFYIEALQTEDVDAFVFLPESAGPLVTLSPVYAALEEVGGVPEHEHVRFGQWPLQILTDANELIAEAIDRAIAVDYEGVSTRVFRAEHVCAIALQTGRAKDFLRVSMFLQNDAVSMPALNYLIERFKLETQFARARSLHDRG